VATHAFVATHTFLNTYVAIYIFVPSPVTLSHPWAD